MPKIKTACCVCGKEIFRWPYQIRDSANHSCYSRACFAIYMCGSEPPNKAKLSGQKFGILTVIESAGTKKGHTLWKCKCECGNETFVTAGLLRYGATASCGCLSKRRGSAHPNWRRGYTITQSGYKEIPILGSHGKHRYVSEHRTIVEQAIGRPLRKDEVVHHINFDKLDNRLENLQVMTSEEHAALHAEYRLNP